MSWLVGISRVALGVIMLVFGLNGFFHFLPVPPLTARGQEFINDLITTGYMQPLWKGTEVVTGIFFLLNRYVALAIVLIAPVLVNIVAFHVFLDPGNTLISLILAGLWTIVAVSKWKNFRPLFEA